MTEISEAQALERFRALIGFKRGPSELANEMGISRAYVHKMLKGEAPLNAKALEMAGVARRDAYFVIE